MELDTIGDTPTAMFFIISDTDDSMNFLVSMAYTQMFNLLCEKADDQYNGRLPVHVRCLIDECANIGQIPKLEKLMATIRSREISASLILQTQSQLKALYIKNLCSIHESVMPIDLYYCQGGMTLAPARKIEMRYTVCCYLITFSILGVISLWIK